MVDGCFETVNNKNSVGVEMCVQAGYDFDRAFANTVEFVRQLMEETGITADRVVQHYDVCAKNCPSQIRAKGMWEEFQRQIKSGGSGQVQHLKAYADTEGLVNLKVDPRFRYVARGCAPYVEWLGIPENPQGKGWAAGAGDGGKILAILRSIIGNSGDAGGSMEGSGNQDQPIKPLSGFVKVFYKGKDGVNVRKAPCMGDNVDQVVFDGVYTVVGISADGLVVSAEIRAVFDFG